MFTVILYSLRADMSPLLGRERLESEDWRLRTLELCMLLFMTLLAPLMLFFLLVAVAETFAESEFFEESDALEERSRCGMIDTKKQSLIPSWSSCVSSQLSTSFAMGMLRNVRMA